LVREKNAEENAEGWHIKSERGEIGKLFVTGVGSARLKLQKAGTA